MRKLLKMIEAALAAAAFAEEGEVETARQIAAECEPPGAARGPKAARGPGQRRWFPRYGKVARLP